MPRFLSVVTGLASLGLSAGPTQTLSTPFTGARKLMNLPSGLRCGDARSGLPNRTSRGIRPVFSPVAVGSMAIFFAAGGWAGVWEARRAVSMTQLAHGAHGPANAFEIRMGVP